MNVYVAWDGISNVYYIMNEEGFKVVSEVFLTSGAAAAYCKDRGFTVLPIPSENASQDQKEG